MTISKEQLETIFRRKEVDNRLRRNKALLKNMAELEKEVLPEEVSAIDIAYAKELKRHEKYWDSARAPVGYFSRLWWAIKGGR